MIILPCLLILTGTWNIVNIAFLIARNRRMWNRRMEKNDYSDIEHLIKTWDIPFIKRWLQPWIYLKGVKR